MSKRTDTRLSGRVGEIAGADRADSDAIARAFNISLHRKGSRR